MGVRQTVSRLGRVIALSTPPLLMLLGGCTVSSPGVEMKAPDGKTATDRLYDRTACMASAQTRERSSALRSDTQALSTAFNGTASHPDDIGTGGLSGPEGPPGSLIGHALYDQYYSQCMERRGYTLKSDGRTVDEFGGRTIASGGSGDFGPNGSALTPLATTVPAAAWQPLILRDLNGQSAHDDIPGRILDKTWEHEISQTAQHNLGHIPDLTVVYGLFPHDGTQYLLTMAFLPEPACDNGGATGRECSLCPARVALVDGHRVRGRRAGQLCAELLNWHIKPGDARYQSPDKWGTRARYNPDTRTIDLLTLHDGTPIAACTQSVQVE